MTLYDEMLASYDKKNPRAAYEVSQQIILAGLHRGGFFNHAAFMEAPVYGFSTTCNDFRKTWTSLC